MHIENGVVAGAKMVLSYGTSIVSFGIAAKLAVQSIKDSGAIPLLVKTIMTTFLVLMWLSIAFLRAIKNPIAIKAPGGKMANKNWLSSCITSIRSTVAQSPSNKLAPSNSVPCPSISLTTPNISNIMAKPNPIMSPSKADCLTGFFDAYASALPIMAQLVTIKGRNMPKDWYIPKV